MIKRLLQAATLGVALTAASFGAHALPIGLALVMDESGSIDAGEFNLQTSGYIAALNAALPTDGSIAVGVYGFASSAETIFPMQVINGPADLAALVLAISTNPQSGGGTQIATGINQARADMRDNFGYANLESAVIDVSTDGISGSSPTTPLAAGEAWVTEALLAGLTKANVNCLGIGNNANCDFETGLQSFEIVGVEFADIEKALIKKIRRETGQVPVPATLALFGLGLLVMGGVARKGKQS